MNECHTSKPAMHMYQREPGRLRPSRLVAFVWREGSLKKRIFVFFAEKTFFFNF